LVNLPIDRELTLKKENIVLCLLNNEVIIADRSINEIYFDLKHIQYGWNKEKRDYNDGPARNNYTEDDVVSFFEQLNTLAQTPLAQKAS
jgi:hypothetical protein